LLVGVLLAVVGAFWLYCRQPAIACLSADGPAEWIVYPTPANPGIAAAAERTTVFRRTFQVANVPPHASLRFRGYRRCEIAVNGREVPLPQLSPDGNWKQPTDVDVALFLRVGENQLIAQVSNDNGPPALWLLLFIGGETLASSTEWEASLLGATWLPARLASSPPGLRAGNQAWSQERTFAAVRSHGIVLLLLVALAAALLAAGWYVLRRFSPLSSSRIPARLLAGVIILAWVGLVWWNGLSMPFLTGFDAEEHLAYIRHLCDRGTLPVGNEGFEMHQPPVYYALSAAAFKVSGVSANGGDACVTLLRSLGLIIGLLGVLLIALCLGRLFPDQPIPQAVGVVLAAALSVHLYLAHYPSNDLLAGAVGTAGVYLALVVLQERSPKAWQLAALGACLGIGILTKLTFVPVAVVVLGVLVAAVAIRTRSVRSVARTAGIPFLVCVAVAGWFFYRNYQNFGHPVVGSYDPASGFRWWQDPGYADAGQFVRFGGVLDAPFYTVFQGLPDGLYSTFWGDGGWGGGVRGWRPPWNYPLMTAGYLLALIPTLLIVVGFAAMVVEWARRPTAERGLILALPVAAAGAIAYQYVQYPFYCHIKAYYALPAIICACAFAGRGFALLTSRSAWAGYGLGILLGTWALTAFASFLINPSTPATLVWIGNEKLRQGQVDAAQRLALAAVAADNADPDARFFLGSLLLRRDRGLGTQYLRDLLASDPDNLEARLSLARALVAGGDNAAAANELRELIRLAPDHSGAYPLLAALLVTAGNADAAGPVAREGLRVMPTHPGLHFSLARVLLHQKDTPEAVAHYRFALRFDPHSVAALSGLAWVLAAHEDERFRNGPEAVRLAEQAAGLTQRKDFRISQLLAAAYAQIGQFEKAAKITAALVEVAGRSGNPRVLEQVRQEQQAYQNGKPLRLPPDALLQR
jgi:Flp pilus assembly protein TadD